MQSHIYIDEALECLKESKNIQLFTEDMQDEITSFCDQVDLDESYIFADLILNEKIEINWEVLEEQVSQDEIRFVLPLQVAEKQLKRSVYDILNSNKLIHQDGLSIM
ncbi:MAG: hypothetical protein K2X04_04940 [Burkholderiales bacterium]|nr:hypothetical protein [Burkholderiales bacterium]